MVSPKVAKEYLSLVAAQVMTQLKFRNKSPDTFMHFLKENVFEGWLFRLS